jgi:hypothetical protein
MSADDVILLRRTLASGSSRRRVLRGLAGGLAALLPIVANRDDVAAKNKKKNKGRKKKKRKRKNKKKAKGCGQTACFVRAWGSEGDGEGEFGFPRGIAVGPNGDV